MALEATFQDLLRNVQGLRDALRQLSICFDDRPPQEESYLVQQRGDVVVELLALSDEASGAAQECCHASGCPLDLDRLRRALARAQETIQRIERHFSAELLDYERITELRSFARRRRGEWPSWLTGVRASLEDCRKALQKVNGTLFQSWQEIAERVGVTSVSLRSTTNN
jgi:hypothetical protein